MSKILYNQLFKYQKDILDTYGKYKQFGLYLDMGLGKTITSLAFCEYNNADLVIIFTTKAKAVESEKDKGSFDFYLKQAGYEIIKKDKNNEWDNTKLKDRTPDDFKVIYYTITTKKKTAIITNYHTLLDKKQKDTLPLFIKELIKVYHMMNIAFVFDESHKLKNDKSKTFKNAEKLINFANSYSYNLVYTYLLSGTPWTKGFIDLYSQLKLLGLDMKKSEFVNEFAIKGNIRGLLEFQQPIIGYKNTDKLFKIVKQHAITELTENVIKLPEKVFKDILVPSSFEYELFTKPLVSKKNQNNFMKFLKLRGIKKESLEVPNPFYRNLSYPLDTYIADTPSNFWMRTRQLNNGFQGNKQGYEVYDNQRIKKVKELIDLQPDNYVVFYNYHPELLMLWELFHKEGYAIDIWSGDVKEEYFYNEYAKFSQEQKLNDKVKRVILANYVSGGEGKNWQHYSRMILYSLPLFSQYEQALKRIHRVGQNKPVFYYRIYSDNKLDKAMLKALEEKKEYNVKLFENDIV